MAGEGDRDRVNAAGDANNVERVRVWDPFVRSFHWLLVIAVATAWWLGSYGPFDKTFHFYAGYAVGGLVALRLIWGVIGPSTARFAQFVRGPATVARYATTVPARQPSGWRGHNPLGAWSVVALLALLLVQVMTGLMADDDIFNTGPLRPYVSSELSATATAVHAQVSELLLVFVALHVFAIAFYAIWKRENLIRPMITGWKYVRRDHMGAEGGHDDTRQA